MDQKTQEGLKMGDLIEVAYEISTEDVILESTRGTGPLKFKLGSGLLHPMIEKPLLGMSTGDSREYTVDASMNFGPRREDLLITMATKKFPEAVQALSEGDSLEMKDPEGKMRLFRVSAKTASRMTLDGNHPLAGEILYVRVTLLSKESCPSPDAAPEAQKL
jgi:peptidylprolyl isomerase